MKQHLIQLKALRKWGLIFASFVFFILTIIIVMRNCSFSPEYYEKEKFNSKELSTISKCVDMELNTVTIDKGTFSHAKESVFVFYISNIQTKEILSQFEKKIESKKSTTYQSRSNPKIKCIMDNNSNTATIRIEEYNSDLYQIFKDSAE